MSRIKLMNTMIDNLTMDEALRRIDELIMENNNSFVVTPNVDHIVKLEKDEALQKAYESADLILVDGKPLIWISKWYNCPVIEKISGSDLFPKLCELAEKRGYRVFLLGAAEGVADKAAKNLVKRFPGLQICGAYAPPIGFENDNKEVEHIIDVVRVASPHILVVGLGCPKQELFMNNYKTSLGVPISLGLGASIDFAAGSAKRAPRWMSEHGLEWFYRFVQEPHRLFKRYFVEDLRIINIAIKYKILDDRRSIRD